MDIEPDDTQEGKVVTPLPPSKLHSAEGIVNPKPPMQVAREEAERLKEMPKEFEPHVPEEESDTSE